MAGVGEPIGATGRSGLSGTATVVIAVAFAAIVGGSAVAIYRVDIASQVRTGELEQRLAKAEARISDLNGALLASESRLRRAESVVAADQSEAAARNAERLELATSASKYVHSLEVAIAQRGIINKYSRAQAARLENVSHFNVADMKGVVEYRGTDGALVGSSPFQIVGTLLAGQTGTLSVSAGEVTGTSSGANSKVVVQSLTILGGK